MSNHRVNIRFNFMLLQLYEVLLNERSYYGKNNKRITAIGFQKVSYKYSYRHSFKNAC